ncbi:reverse transcriptase/maturase family protein [Ammoniphilus sp. YIM 78166]|uniref:reverse transcriptase/maturase family protein n=1 Tax=Ammoniphilus sp. YIM 78166 TaxID=1644106 RepID=UPI00106FA8F1|nr:reverse transcriptase/maturase family protein [Ammoniphilus sp. YIM 78166]
MRSPIVVLNTLASKSTCAEYKFQRLYRNLYNPDFFLQAYDNIYAKEGNMTKGTDGQTIDDMSLKRIESLIESLKDQSYQPKAARRVYILKKNGQQRPLGIPSFNDKLVQEVVRMILESIYDSSFSDSSHGFRPNHSCHSALHQIKRRFTGVKWFVEGDISGFFDHIDHHTLVNILRKRIQDENFIDLIWKFLKAGFLEDWTYHKTYSGTPQGGIISPILANIYLNEFDQFMHTYKEQFDVGKKHTRNKEYRSIEHKLYKARKRYKETKWQLSEHEQEQAVKEIKELEKQLLSTPYNKSIDSNYKRIQYVRYADDFLIGIIGSKKDAMQVKGDISAFLRDTLKLELSQEKTLITNSRDKARFLGYDIAVSRGNSYRWKKDGTVQRLHNLKCELYMPHDAWEKKLWDKKVMKLNDKTGKWKPIHRAFLIHNDDLEILETYNSEIRGLYNYYKLAVNVHALDMFKYIMEYSMYKTFANKYKSTVRKMLRKYSINGEFGVRYRTKEGQKIRFFYNQGFKRQEFNPYKINPGIDVELNILNMQRTSLIERLLAEKCEWCGTENVPMHIHHVRKLKDLQGKKRWEKHMIARKRKTLALCEPCHINLHRGKLD